MLSHIISFTGHIVASCGVSKTKISRHYVSQNITNITNILELLGVFHMKNVFCVIYNEQYTVCPTATFTASEIVQCESFA